MKKILFTAYDLNVGGIEKALVTLLNKLNDYDITLVLEHKEGIFLNLIPKNIKVIEYKVSTSKFTIFRKIYNRLKLILFTRKIKNKYAFSCSFATYSIPGAHIALAASSNNCLYLHANYYVLYNNDAKKMSEFLDSVMIKRFKKLVYVSKENMLSITSHYNNISEKGIVCNNLIDDDMINKLSYKEINEKFDGITFVNIGRHDEKQKQLINLFNATKKLTLESYKFRLYLIGDGPDTKMYKDFVSKNNLDNNIIFLGRKENPYPYFKKASATVLSSKYEGYPVVFLEAMTLNCPIISTKVSDWKELDREYGIFDDNIYNAMKEFLDHGFIIKKKFDAKRYNDDILNKIKELINNE